MSIKAGDLCPTLTTKRECSAFDPTCAWISPKNGKSYCRSHKKTDRIPLASFIEPVEIETEFCPSAAGRCGLSIKTKHAKEHALAILKPSRFPKFVVVSSSKPPSKPVWTLSDAKPSPPAGRIIKFITDVGTTNVSLGDSKEPITSSVVLENAKKISPALTKVFNHKNSKIIYLDDSDTSTKFPSGSVFYIV